MPETQTAPNRKTAFTKFFSCNPQQDALFAVNAGISAADALETASSFLATADNIMNAVAVECDNHSVWSATYLVEISKAIVNAALLAINKENQACRNQQSCHTPEQQL